jgi:hypothetical protein
MIRAWDKRPDESAAAFAQFQVFRDLGPGRTLVAAYRRRTGKPTATPTGSYRKLARDFDWTARAEAFDSHLDGERIRGSESEAVKAGITWERRRQDQLEKNWQISQALMKKAEQLAAMPITRITRSEDGQVTVIEALPANTLRHAASVATAASNLAWAVIQEAMPDGDDGFDVSKATIEELQNYLERGRSARQRKSA